MDLEDRKELVKTLLIIPAYNEEESLKHTIDSLQEKAPWVDFLIVNDGSTDGTERVCRENRYPFLGLATNLGLAGAFQAGLKYAYRHGYDCAIQFDADGQHLPADVVRVSEDWEAHPEALVLGSRRFTGTVPWRSRAGNAITRVVFRLSTGVSVYDTQTGLRAFAVSSIPMMLEMRGERYEYEINVLLYATRQHMPIREVTIETVYIADNASSHFHPMRDSWRIYKMILLFAASSLLAAAVDYVLVLSLSALFAKQAQGLLWSVVLARVISSFLNYMLNRKLVFEDCSRRSVFRYYLVAAGIMAANYGLLSLISGVMPLALAKLLVELALYPLSFYLQRRFVFARGERIS